jgi:hypothetical protein
MQVRTQMTAFQTMIAEEFAAGGGSPRLYTLDISQPSSTGLADPDKMFTNISVIGSAQDTYRFDGLTDYGIEVYSQLTADSQSFENEAAAQNQYVPRYRLRYMSMMTDSNGAIGMYQYVVPNYFGGDRTTLSFSYWRSVDPADSVFKAYTEAYSDYSDFYNLVTEGFNALAYGNSASPRYEQIWSF